MRTYINIMALATLGWICALGNSFAAERVWDSELRRYITDDDFKYEEFMTEDEAVKRILPKSQRIRKETIRLPQDKKSLIEQRIGWKFPEDPLISTSGRPETGWTAMPWCTTRSASTSR